jgi:hypothetical protein
MVVGMVFTVMILLVPRVVVVAAVVVLEPVVVLAITQEALQLMHFLAREVVKQQILAVAVRPEQLIIMVRVPVLNGAVAVAVGQIKMAALVELEAARYLAAVPVARVAV